MAPRPYRLTAMSEAPQLRLLRRDATEAPRSVRRRRRRRAAPPRPGPALVHGSMDRAASFTRLMGRLRRWDIVAYDRRGYASWAVTGPPTTFDDQVDDLLEVLDGEPAVAFGAARRRRRAGDGRLPAGTIPAAFVWEPPQPWLPWWTEATGRRSGEPELKPDERAESFMRRMVGDRVWERLRLRTGPSGAGKATRSKPRSTAWPCRRLRPRGDTDSRAGGRGGHSSGYQRRAAAELAEACQPASWSRSRPPVTAPT